MSNGTYLVHHGVKGMHWGVRRYQNYDGSYKNGADGQYSTKGISDKNKRRLKTAAAVVGTAAVVGLAGYGAYKYGDKILWNTPVSALAKATNSANGKVLQEHINRTEAEVDKIVKTLDAQRATISKIDVNKVEVGRTTVDRVVGNTATARKVRFNQASINTFLNNAEYKKEKAIKNLNRYSKDYTEQLRRIEKDYSDEIQKWRTIGDKLKASGKIHADVSENFADLIRGMSLEDLKRMDLW